MGPFQPCVYMEGKPTSCGRRVATATGPPRASRYLTWMTAVWPSGTVRSRTVPCWSSRPRSGRPSRPVSVMVSSTWWRAGSAASASGPASRWDAGPQTTAPLGEAEAVGDALAEVLVDVGPVLDDALRHLRGDLGRRGVADDVLHQVGAVGLGEHVLPEGARLDVVVVLGVPGVRGADEFAGDLVAVTHVQARVRDGAAEGVGRVHRVRGVAEGHRPVLVVAVHRHVGRVDRQLLVVRADPVAVRVRVGEEPALEH